MSSPIEVFLGAPIEVESERLFLARLCADLEAAGQRGLILGNFLLPPRKPIFQIDFLVILDQLACHVELKCLTARISGAANGRWSLWLADGSQRLLDGKNPYRQALDNKFAISDQMHNFAIGHPSVQRPAPGLRFYSQIESVVCIYPDLVDGSSVPDDKRVRVKGYPTLKEFITTTTRNPGWSRDDWRNFAMELGLVRQDEFEGAGESAESAASELVSDYRRRFLDFYGSVPRLVPTTVEIAGSESRSDHLLQFVSTGRHAQLIGRSGCGKSHHAIHMALAASENGGIPILARAADYSGKLSCLLDRSVAHLCPCTGLQVIHAARRLSAPVTLLVDGFNECPERLKPSLTKDLQAFYLLFRIPIIFTAQTHLRVPENLAGQVVSFRDPQNDERLAILQTYAADELPSNAVELCKPFHTPFELAVAASCLADITDNPTRSGLFDAYLRRRFSDRVDVTLARRVLCEIADSMRAGFRSTLPVADVWRIGERVIHDGSAPPCALQEIMSSGVIDIAQGTCAFRHEMLQRFFEAAALYRNSANTEVLIGALKKPTNHELLEFVLGMLGDAASYRSCLQVAAKGDVATKLVSQCLVGGFGRTGRDVVMNDAKRVLRAAERELASLDFEVKADPPHEECFQAGDRQRCNVD